MKEINELDVPGLLEKHFKHHEHRLVDKFVYKGWTVYLSEGGPYFPENYHGGNPEFPLGWYETAYTILSGSQYFYQPLAFDYLHDIRSLTEDARKKGRLNATREKAINHIDEALEIENGTIH